MLVTDMYYFNELFKKEIWTKDVIDELWDIPDNFDELSSNEKTEIYYKNYSKLDYLDKLQHNLLAISRNSYYNFFSYFLSKLSRNRNNLDYELIGSEKFNSEVIWDLEEFIKEEAFYLSSINSKLGCCFFIKAQIKALWNQSWEDGDGEPTTIEEVPFLHFLETLKLRRTSVFFITENVFEKMNYGGVKNLHPIILKEEEDIHQLLDFIIRDIKNETRPKRTHQPNTYLEEITIKNYFSLEKVEMKNLGDKKEIYLMGENGDGKTILLQALALALRGNKNIGGVTDIVKQNPHEKMSLVAMTNDGKKYAYSENPKTQKEIFEPLLAYGINRFQNDSDKKDEVGFLSLFNKHTYLENPVKWLQHLDYKEIKNDYSEISLGQAKDILTDILERDVTITVTPDKVTFTEKGTILEFDQLSDGYQSVIIWVCDLIARLSVLQPNVSSTHDYSGIVLVDEIGAFLHPKWAYGIVNKLKTWFPQIQFIFTTHNPIIILGASEDAAFYKVYKENGKTKVSEPVEDISDLMLNSLVTSPLFNLPTARPKGFDESNDLSSDDYVYRRIHQMIQEKLQTMPNLVDDDVIRMIEAELEKI
jgi:predicted ATPase